MSESNKQNLKEKLEKMPYIETKVTKSKSGEWIVIKTTITQILSKNYFKAMFSKEGKEDELF